MKRTTSKTRYTDFHMIINSYDKEGVDFLSLAQDQLEWTLEEAEIKTRSNFIVFQDCGGQL